MKRIKIWGAGIIFGILLLRPEAAVSCAQRAMRVWYSSVAPALFPFLVLMPLLTGREACAAYETLFSWLMRPVFRLPGSAAPALIAGMLAGSPGGAITLRRVAENSGMTASEAGRIALAVGGVSPAYLVMGVGLGIHGSVSTGIKLAVAQACIQLLVLIIIPAPIQSHEKLNFAVPEKEQKSFITGAIESVLGICGYMVFFSVIAGALSGFLGKGPAKILLLIMDLPSGLENLKHSGLPMKMILQSAAIGFTGLCIISQNMNELREMGIGWRKYLGARMVSAILLALVSVGFQDDWNAAAGNTSIKVGKTYAASLFAVGIVVLPGLYLLSKKLFLNKSRSEEI